MADQSCASSDRITLYVQCLLNEDEAEQLESHISTCPNCREGLASAINNGLAPEWLEACRNSKLLPLVKSLTETKKIADTLAGSGNDNSVQPRATEEWSTVGLERYRFERPIGEGGMSVVWEGSDNVMRRRVALKRLKSTGVSGALASRLLQEAASLARLSHPSIVGVYEILTDHSQPTLVMELVNGPTLCDWRRGKIIPERQVARLIEQLALAVQHAHDNGVLHRDLKPSNILLSVPRDWNLESSDLSNVVPKLSDFGLARIMGEQHLTQTGEMLGTPAYMAPEQTLGVVNAVGPTADVYGLGAIMYDLLTGTPPHTAQDPVSTLALVRERDPVAPRLLRPELSKDLETVCLKCLRKSASDRYATAGELAADLRSFLDGHVIKARPVGPTATVIRWCRKHRLLSFALGVTALSILAMVVGAVLFARTERQLRQQADDALARAIQSEADAKAETARADAMRELIKKNYDISMNAVSNLVTAAGLSGEVIDLDKLRETALLESSNVFKSFVDSLPEPDQWSLSDALALTRYIEFAHRQSQPIDGRPWLEKLSTVLDRLENENEGNPDRFVVRQKYAREMAILAQLSGDNEAAAQWWQTAAEIQEKVVALDPQNAQKNYVLAQASMNSALYHSYCSRPSTAVGLAEKSVAAYRKILDIGEQADRHHANFIEKLFWQARFERENGNQERFEIIKAEALDRCERFLMGSPYRSRLEESRTEIIGN